MPTKYTGRVILILAVFLISVFMILPPGSWFDSHLTFGEKLALKPGIDMVGGTSLLYEIKTPDGSQTINGRNLAEQVMESLKKRVDPDGVRNLIWRPQGNNRLEIQMPTNKQAGEAAKIRKEYASAQQKLEDTNVRAADVLRAVETLHGDARMKRLNELAMGSDTRAKLFGAMASAWDQIQQAKAKKDAATQAEKELEYEKLKNQIDDTNLSASALEATLGLPPKARDPKLAEMKKQASDFKARQTAIDEFEKAYGQYSKVKGSLDDAGDLKRLLRGSGVLEFHILVDWDPRNPQSWTPQVREMYDRLQKSGPAVKAGDTMRWFSVDDPTEFKSESALDAQGKPFVLAYITPDKSMANGPGIVPWSLTGAQPTTDPQSSEREVAFTFDAQGAQDFGNLSGSNIGKQLGIVLDDRMISAPVLNSKITSSGVISGNKSQGGFTAKEVGYLVNMLSAGSLPAKLTDEPISERTVGSTIGADNLRYGLISCGLGLVVVVVFLVGYYYLAGVVASFAVLLNVIIILGVMAMFKATFTLPAVAGIVLTIGAAVDANVLIFERFREEQQRGLSLRMAMRNAYDRAFSAIIDSNATTIVTSIFLYWFGSEEVKGFGLTLLIGLVSSLFTALYVTKTIFGLMIDRGHITHLNSFPLTHPKWDHALRPNIDWMKYIWYFVTFSAVCIVVGMTAFVIKTYEREMADIEFASGTSVQFELKKPMDIEQVRHLLEDPKVAKDLPSPSVVSVGNEGLEYEVVTPSDKPEVKTAVLHAMGDRLKIELPSQFDSHNLPIQQAQQNKVVLPIENTSFAVDGWQPPSAESYIGGAAIVLRDLNPKISAKQVHERIERQRLLAQAQSSAATYRDYVVESPTPADQPADMVVILTADSNLPYEKDPLKWRDEVAGPMWQLVNDAVGKDASLQKVTTFNPQVAGDAQRDALMALALSVLAIMVYIWFRFGNLKYGTATVVAMIHDTLLVIAFLGLSHWVSQYLPWVAHALMIEPFRINLTIVAAVLTVMSYSMIDTIVVFDRVRENRGKFGHLSRRIVNDSINQTLSRTLLTGSTNLMTVFIMYVMGGPGIHGFTFVLLTGILVGTYSSVAIAAPILLIGRESHADAENGEGTRPGQPGDQRKLQPAGQLQRA
jgi:SecD/SecF fusion protein